MTKAFQSERLLLLYTIWYSTSLMIAFVGMMYINAVLVIIVNYEL